jgi:hypothetical protein
MQKTSVIDNCRDFEVISRLFGTDDQGMPKNYGHQKCRRITLRSRDGGERRLRMKHKLAQKRLAEDGVTL